VNTSSTIVGLSPGRASVALVVVLAVLYAGFTGWVVRAGHGTDFRVYYYAANQLLDGRSPYSPSEEDRARLTRETGQPFAGPYRYPPFTAILVMPLTRLGWRDALVVWDLASGAAMVLGAWLIGRARGGEWSVPIALAMLLLFVPPLDTLFQGQVNGFLFLSLAVGFWALSTRRDTVAGIAVACGAALKIVPLGLVPWLAWRRRWRAVGGALLALGVLIAVCVPLVGAEVFVEYIDKAGNLATRHLDLASPANQTITAVLARLPGVSLEVARATGAVLALALIAVTALLCRPRRSDKETIHIEYGLIITTVALVPTFSWTHQLVVLLIPLLIAVETLVARRQRYHLLALGVLVLASNLTMPVWYRMWETLIDGWVWRTMSAPFLLTAVTWCWCALALQRRARETLAATDTSSTVVADARGG